jgi:hypothetical protein
MAIIITIAAVCIIVKFVLDIVGACILGVTLAKVQIAAEEAAK